MQEFNPLDQLNSNDFKTIEKYIAKMTGYEIKDNVENLLYEWNLNKKNLYRDLFDNSSLRFKTHISFDLSSDYDYLKKAVINASVTIVCFTSNYMRELEYSGQCLESDVYKVLSLFNPNTILKGFVSDGITFSNFKKTKTFHGKIMKVIRKVFEFYNIPAMDMFKKFRDDISLITTTKKIDTNIVISIHPIDFLSMSENSCGWSSCMSLGGTCASGISEIMNSQTAVIAYIESKEPYIYGIPNKSWRQLIFADKERGFVLSSRQYPYQSGKYAEFTVKSIAEKMFGEKFDISKISRYPDTHFELDCVLKHNLDNWDVKNITKSYKEIENGPGIISYSNCGCNDFLMFPTDLFYKYQQDSSATVRFCLSGPSTCLLCGSPIDKEYVGTNKIVCKKCERSFL